MTRRSTLPALAACLTTLLLVSCGSSGGGSGGREDGVSEDLRPFEVVLDWTPNTNHAGMYLAKANGWYEDAGLDVSFIEPGEAGSLQALAAGKADVAVSVQDSYAALRKGRLGEAVGHLAKRTNLDSLRAVAEEFGWIVRF